MFRSLPRFLPTLGLAAAMLAPSMASAALVDVSGEIVNPNNTIGVGNTANLVGNAFFGWQTGNSSIDVITNGFNFALDSGNGNALNYSGSISGDSDVRFRMAPEWSGLANNALVISGATSNTYTGISRIEYGHVLLQKTGGATAIAGNIIIGGQGTNDRLSLGGNEQIADTAMLSFTGTKTATFNLAGFTETIGVLQVAANAVIDTGAGGVLKASAVNIDGNWLAPGTYDAGSLAFISGGGSLTVTSGDAPPAGNAIGLNFAGANNNPGGRKVIAGSTVAGAPGFEQTNWNNTPGTAQTGTPSSANDTLLNLFDNKGFVSPVDITFTAPQTWGSGAFGSSPTGDQQLNGNGITDGTSVRVSEIPFSEYDVVLYIGNYDGRNATVTLTAEDGTVFERFVTMPVWDTFVDYIEVSDLATSPATRELGNYLVFSDLVGTSFTVSASTGGINAIQIVGPQAAAIPEPASMLLIGLAAAGIAFSRRKNPIA